MIIKKKNNKLIFFNLIVTYIMLSNIMIIFNLTGLVFNQNLRNLMIYFIFIWSGFEYVKKMLYQKISKINILILAYSLYILIITFINDRNMHTAAVLLNTLLFPSIFSLSLTLNRNQSFSKTILYIQGFFMIISSYIYLIYSNKIVESAASVNSIYYVVLTIPFVLCMEKKIVKSLALVISCIAILYSLKRTALLASSIAFFTFFITQNKISLKLKRSRFWFLVSCFSFLTIILFSYNYLNDYFGINIFSRFATLKEDGGSGRINLIFITLDRIGRSGFLSILFGHGYDGVARYIGISSHNDFLEILFNYGLIGLTFYLLLWSILLRCFLNMLKNKYRFSAAFGASLSIFLIMSLTSHLIFVPTYFSLIVIFWGYSIYDYENYNACKTYTIQKQLPKVDKKIYREDLVELT